MNILKCASVTLLVLLGVTLGVKCYKLNQYQPTWESLDTRPLPAWYDDAKIGIFIHWGVFSVPAFSEWFWHSWRSGDQNIARFMAEHYPPGFDYADFAHQFKAEAYDPKYWASLFKDSGAKYVVLTSKHHEGYTLWQSNNSWNWNSVDTGPHKDLIEPLATEVRNAGLKFGLYHSLFEWYNPIYLADQEANWTTQNFVNWKSLPELYDIVKRYKPEIIFSDGDWDAPDDYWRSREFIAWLYNESPVRDTVVTNDRWGKGTNCMTHGDYINCQDRFKPGQLINKKWEQAMTIDKGSWGFRRFAGLGDYLTMKELLREVIESIAYGGNILINVGPRADGLISPIYEERLRGLGNWLAVNGQAIYSSKPWRVAQMDKTAGVYYTRSKDAGTLYAIFMEFPENGELTLFSLNDTMVTQDTKAELLINGGSVPVSIKSGKDSIKATISQVPLNELKNEAWVIKFTSIQCNRRNRLC